MKKNILLILFLLLFLMPADVIAQKAVPILVYHSIAEYKGQGSKELFVAPENFEKQIRYLKDQGFTLLSFERWNEIGRVSKPVFITFDDGYKNVETAFAIFRKLSDDKFQPVGTIFAISDFVGRPNRLLKTDLKRMADSGYFSIQSHTATHPDLTKLTDFLSELKGSKDKIEKITGKPVIALSYPYGNFNARVVAETKKYYQFGITTTPGPYIEKGLENELYLIPRTYVKYSTTLTDFAKIVGVSQ
ncbi:polysaccharide deacetylase family protein [Peribacillus glennii]|uniref:Polysaccharide deacetylase family protein n=1 Tax=Peribacillus glennii TaxID=2303991 RepID=A0A372LH32_9BACI|nr:polysaccharide deacetylase family protein [Peribacillus glennii]RFU65252.1 polysaccharide deacetylase family protein [Peribacillus glennii]